MSDALDIDKISDKQVSSACMLFIKPGESPPWFLRIWLWLDHRLQPIHFGYSYNYECL